MYLMVYMQFTSANDFNDIKRTGKVYGTRAKSSESSFFQDQCPVKAQSVSKLGYFQSV